MALIGARGITLVSCFLIVAGILEYLIIIHIHSGKQRVHVSSDGWDNPRLGDGFSKVDSVEVENLEAKFKKIKYFPGKNMKEWNKKKKELLKDWRAGDSEWKKDGRVDDDKINIQPPPSRELDSKQQKVADKKTDLEKELNIQKRAIDKKAEDYSEDEYDVDEHGKPKYSKRKEEKNKENDGGDLVHKADDPFQSAAKALAALSNLKKMASIALGKKEEEKKIEEKNGEDEVAVLNKPENGGTPIFNNNNEFIDFDQNSMYFNGRAVQGELLVETDNRRPYRTLTPFEKAGNNIMFTLRTTRPFHDKRLPLLFDTWMRKANHSNIFIVTDGEDEKWLKKTWEESMHYILTSCGKTYLRNELCCKAGIELALIFKESSQHYDWLCHIDDDIYVNLPRLVKVLSRFDPKKEPVYFGRSGSGWRTPRKVMDGAGYGKPGQTYHFAVGGMYCLSRPMLQLAKPYLIGGKNFAQSCSRTLEPEDVTVGVVVGVMLNKTLSRTESIYTHGLHLGSTVDPYTLDEQIAFAYGYGAIKWGYEPYNAIYVPNGLFSYTEDESQFRSLFCHLYPEEQMCIEKRRMYQQKLSDFKSNLTHIL